MFPKSQVWPHQACSRWLIDPPAKPKLLLSKFLNQCLLMLALWSCGRRGSVVQAQRQIHRASRATFTIAETVVRTIVEQAAAGADRRKARIGGHGSEDHSARGF